MSSHDTYLACIKCGWRDDGPTPHTPEHSNEYLLVALYRPVFGATLRGRGVDSHEKIGSGKDAEQRKETR